MIKRFLHQYFCFWRRARFTGANVYERCSFCGARRGYHLEGAGHQPLDIEWIKTRNAMNSKEATLFKSGTAAKVFQTNAPDIPCLIESTYEVEKGEFKGQWARVTLIGSGYAGQKSCVRVSNLIF